LTIRPAFCANAGRTLVKADYKQVEARVLPWLSKSKGGDQLLDSFRASDADPSAPDLYKVTAAGMMRKNSFEVTKEERQRGKVAVLACGFGGGKNALHSMAAVYRMHFTDTEAQAIVDAWRKANAWAPAFWGKYNREDDYGLFGAAMNAVDKPHSVIKCGRVAFVYAPIKRDGLLLCILPSGRPLLYPSCKVRDYEIRDKKTKKVVDVRHGLSFKRGFGEPVGLYGGRFAENVTQAAAADLLRESIVTLVNGGHRVVSHSHDEIVVDCAIEDVAATKAAMEAAMLAERGWADGLPLAVDTTERWYYSAAKQPGE
jgi:DNA polymerase